jgi:hypothetical protein
MSRAITRRSVVSRDRRSTAGVIATSPGGEGGQQLGNGVNWTLIAETLFKAAFEILDKLPEEDRRTMARRIHTGAYDRAVGNRAAEEAGNAKPPVESSNAVVFAKASRPHPPR